MVRVSLIAAGLIAVRLAAYAVLVQGDLPDGLCQFDCGWYLSIATAGYDDAPHLVRGLMQANWAFFPLFPLLERAAIVAIGLAPVKAGMAVATLGMFGFAVLGWCYRARSRSGAGAVTWLLVLTAWPYGLYFTVPYSESLYALLATGGLLALAAGRPWLAAVASAALTATRPTGILFAAWFGLEQVWRARRLGLARCMAPVVVAPLGLVGFMATLWWKTGDPLAFAHIQQAWGHAARNPLAMLVEALQGDDRPGFHPGHFYGPGWALLGLAGAGVLARRRPAEAWLLAMTVLLALASGSVWSIARFVGACPVWLFLVADMVEAIGSRRVRMILLVGMAVLQAVLVRAWFDGASILM